MLVPAPQRRREGRHRHPAARTDSIPAENQNNLKKQLNPNRTRFRPVCLPRLIVGMGVPNETVYRDPWAKREAWRQHPVFARRTQIRNMFPGFGIALIAFSGYVAWDNLSSPDSKTIQELRKQSEDQIKQKDSLLGWITGQGDKK
ncbi:hypothetical protein PGT21_030674 [Puccinia graminis f. sp. tritici]|nr:hypothetical protein PGT21_030674 [Puccinia graminis f. sp. tritici]KAA1131327.1 hypothetical protein PGTUg99_031623 [Puccinia graminis f. sp. tritici]